MMQGMATDEEKKKRQREAQARYLSKPENREKALAATRSWAARNPEKVKEHEAARDKEAQRERARVYMREQREKKPRHVLSLKMKNVYGITLEEFEILEKSQEGVCAICKKTETWVRDGKVFRLSVDHCHDTGKIRGLLCKACNTGIGYFLHDPELLQAAIRYLKHPPAAPFVGK